MNRRKICIQPLSTEENEADFHEHNQKYEKVEVNSRRVRKDNSIKSTDKHNRNTANELKDISGRINNLQDYNSISTTSSNPKSSDIRSQYQQNKQKIEKLRDKLSQLYSHYQTERINLEEMKSKIENTNLLKEQNKSISLQIGRIKNMVKEALLAREKNRLTARKP